MKARIITRWEKTVPDPMNSTNGLPLLKVSLVDPHELGWEKVTRDVSKVECPRMD